MPLQTGRKPRTFDPRVPHFSALRMMNRHPLPPIPVAVDYSTGSGRLADNLGMMCNDRLGCCTSAAAYHARQVWTDFAQGAVDTETDALVVQFYSECSGYNPAHPETDQGANEQDVLNHWLNVGQPIGNPDGRDRLIAFVELDPRNMNDVRRAIWECGGVYIGFEVPAPLMADGEPPLVWDWDRGEDIDGGHAVYAVGYNVSDGTITVISWGKRYCMTRRMWLGYVDEVYALVANPWIEKTGRTPLGMSVEDLSAQVNSLRY